MIFAILMLIVGGAMLAVSAQPDEEIISYLVVGIAICCILYDLATGRKVQK